MKKIEILFTGNFDIEGQPRHCVKGDVIEVNEQDAARMVADKCAKYYEKPKAKVNYDRKNSK